MKFLKLIPLFMIFSTLQASGLDSDQVLTATQVISKINAGNLVAVPELQCSMDDAEVEIPNVSNLYNQCAIDLCRAPVSNKTAWTLDENFLSNISFWKKLRLRFNNNLFEKIFEKAINNRKEQLAEAKKRLKNPENLYDTLKGNAQLSKKVFMPYLKLVAHEDLPLNERAEIIINAPKNAPKEFITALNDYAASLKSASILNPYILGTDFYTEDEKIMLAKNALAAVKGEVEKNPKALSEEYLFHLKRVETAFKEPKQIPIVFTIQIVTLIDLMNQLEKSTKKDVVGVGACTTLSCTNGLKNYLKQNFTGNENLAKNLASYERLLEEPQTKSHAINRCKATLALYETKQADEKQANRLFEEAKKSMIKNVLPLFSEHSRGIMLDYLNNKLSHSTTRLEYLGKSPNADAIDIFKEQANSYLKDPLNQKLNLENDVLFGKLEKIRDDFESLDPLDDVYACGINNRPTNIWDAFLPVTSLDQDLKDFVSKAIGEKDHVFVSDFSCKNHDHGAQFIAHELGHAISSLFKTTKLSESSALTFSKARSCVKEGHPNAKVSSKIMAHSGDSLYTEEDFADFIGIHAGLQDKNLYNCALLKPSLVDNVYTDLSFTDKGGEDTHSTAFTRVIQEATLKDVAIPQSCQDLIAKVKPNVRFNKCSF